VKIGVIDHVAINCRDLGKSLDFYGRILGFKRLQTVDCGDFDILYFAQPGGGRLELFDYHGQNRKIVAGIPPVAGIDDPGCNVRLESDSGLRHLAFQVQDVAAHEAQLRREGVEITLPTCDLPNLEARVLLFLDPNGVTIEFCEKIGEQAPGR
jgi:glyoxylase I family protein